MLDLYITVDANFAVCNEYSFSKIVIHYLKNHTRANARTGN